ncbi:restriction endonuclease subunit S [Bacillus sp. ms-22]|uniref:restriction endonuclease subunit S n=1 Tax=Bacillus sp. ms-22 TaxID=2683680 RepID=UPI001E5ED8B4|nr:restriction endonuclease subunit S [Bacillus sp. ms-22]
MPEVRFPGFGGEWGKTRLSEMVEIIGGGTPSTNVPEYWDGDINWYSPAEIGNEIYVSDSKRNITELGLKKSSARILPANKTILFTSRAGIGNMAILKKEGATNQGFQSLVVNDENDVYFLYSLGKKIKEYALKNASGSTFLEISGKKLGKMELFIPQLNERIKLGNFFKQLDETIAIQKQELNALKQTKQGFLQKIFPKEGESEPEIRFTGFSGEWRESRLISLVDRVKSYSLSRDIETLKDTGYRYIHYGDIHKKVANIVGRKNELPNIQVGDFELLKKGDLVLADASEDYQGIATPAIVNDDIPYKLVAGLHTIALRPKPKQVNSLFLYYLINSHPFRKHGYRVGTGMKVFGISLTNILKFEYVYPSMDEQTKIGDFFMKLDETITLKEKELDILEQTKKAFLQKMFV